MQNFVLHKKNVKVPSLYLQTLLTVDSARLRDEEGKTVIHCAAEQGKSHKQLIKLNFICAFSGRRKFDLCYCLCLG